MVVPDGIGTVAWIGNVTLEPDGVSEVELNMPSNLLLHVGSKERLTVVLLLPRAVDTFTPVPPRRVDTTPSSVTVGFVPTCEGVVDK